MAISVISTLGFLSLLAINQATDQTCEDLIKPVVLEDNNAIIGKWILSEAISNSSKLASALESLNSSWTEFAPSSVKDTLTLIRGRMLYHACQISSMNVTFQNSTFKSSVRNETTVINLLPSCSDCLTMSFSKQTKNEELRSLFFFLSKRSKASESELNLFRKQAECLGLKKEPQFSYDGVADLCEMDKSDPDEDQKEPEKKKSDK